MPGEGSESTEAAAVVPANIDQSEGSLLRELVGDQETVTREEEMGDVESELSELESGAGKERTGRPNFMRAETGAGKMSRSYLLLLRPARQATQAFLFFHWSSGCTIVFVTPGVVSRVRRAVVFLTPGVISMVLLRVVAAPVYKCREIGLWREIICNFGLLHSATTGYMRSS